MAQCYLRTADWNSARYMVEEYPMYTSSLSHTTSNVHNHVSIVRFASAKLTGHHIEKQKKNDHAPKNLVLSRINISKPLK